MRLAALALAAFLSVSAIAQQPWPMERQDRWGSGRVPTGPAPGQFTTPWVYKIFNPAGTPISHGPALGENGVGYVGTWVNNLVYKIDYRTASVFGTFDTLNFVTCTPAIAPGGGHIFVQSGNLYRINTATMDYDWFLNTGSSTSCIIGPDGDVVAGSGGGTAWRVNANTGIPVWTRPGLTSVTKVPCMSRDDSLVFLATGNRITALRYSDGGIEWSLDTGSGVSGIGAAPDGGVVFGNVGGTIYCLEPSTGALRWSKLALGAITGPPGFSQDGSIAYIPSHDHRVYAHRMSDGQRLWSHTGNEGFWHGPVVASDGRIFAYNRIGFLHAINPDGTTSWIKSFAGGSNTGGAITMDEEGTLYLPITRDSAAMAIIKQIATSISFTTLAIEIGDLVSGGVAEIDSSDDQYVSLKTSNIFTFGRTDPQMRVRLDVNSAYDRLSKFTLQFETSCSIGGSVEQKVEMFNFQTGLWEVLDVRPASLTDSAFAVTVSSNANRFIQGGTKLMRLRANWFVANGPRTWTVKIDQAKLVDVVPEW